MPKKIYGRHTAREHQQFLTVVLSVLIFPFFIIFQIFRGQKSEVSISGDNIAKLCIASGVLFIVSSFAGEASLAERLKVIGMGATLIGGGYAWLQYTKRNKEQYEFSARMSELDRLFNEILTRNKGQITLFEWATAAQLSRDQAKEYLDKRAAEWEASFEISQNGAITYQFPYS